MIHHGIHRSPEPKCVNCDVVTKTPATVTEPSSLVSRIDDVRNLLDRAARDAGRDPAEIRLLAVTKTRNVDEVRAAIWALAQLDDPQAYVALRRIAAEKDRPEAVREYAARILERPRVSLILD